MTDGEPRDWADVRRDAIRALHMIATDHGHDDIIAGHAEQFADAVLAVCDEEAVNRMADTFVNETRIRAIDFRNGLDMELEPSETLVANWVAAAKTFLDAHKAVNYTETEVKIAGDIERYAFILQRIGHGKLTPHEARRHAEAERDKAVALLAELAAVIPPAQFRKLADWFDADDEFKEAMFPETWSPGSRQDDVQTDLRRFANLLDGAG